MVQRQLKTLLCLAMKLPDISVDERLGKPVDDVVYVLDDVPGYSGHSTTHTLHRPLDILHIARLHCTVQTGPSQEPVQR